MSVAPEVPTSALPHHDAIEEHPFPVPTPSQMVPVSEIKVTHYLYRPFNRRHYAELFDSIKAVGLLQPIVVRCSPGDEGDQAKKFLLVAGGHRLMVAIELGWKEIPAVVVEHDDRQAEICTLVENLKRLNFRGKALDQAVARLMDLEGRAPNAQPAKRGRPRKNDAPRTNFTKSTAKKLGVSETKVVRSLLRNTKAGPEVRAALDAGTITETQADELVTLNPEEQSKVLPEIVGKTRTETRAIVKDRKGAPANDRPDPVADADRAQAEPQIAATGRFQASIGELEVLTRDLAQATKLVTSVLAGDSVPFDAAQGATVEALLAAMEQAIGNVRRQLRERLAVKPQSSKTAPVVASAEERALAKPSRRMAIIDVNPGETEEQALARAAGA